MKDEEEVCPELDRIIEGRNDEAYRLFTDLELIINTWPECLYGEVSIGHINNTFAFLALLISVPYKDSKKSKSYMVDTLKFMKMVSTYTFFSPGAVVELDTFNILELYDCRIPEKYLRDRMLLSIDCATPDEELIEAVAKIIKNRKNSILRYSRQRLLLHPLVQRLRKKAGLPPTQTKDDEERHRLRFEPRKSASGKRIRDLQTTFKEWWLERFRFHFRNFDLLG